MSDIEKIIECIEGLDDRDLGEFDFDDCFTALREMEFKLINSIPNVRIENLLLSYESYMNDAPDDDSDLESCQVVIDVLRELLGIKCDATT